MKNALRAIGFAILYLVVLMVMLVIIGVALLMGYDALVWFVVFVCATWLIWLYGREQGYIDNPNNRDDR